MKVITIVGTSLFENNKNIDLKDYDCVEQSFRIMP